tara:strand:+ start:111 stop:437 length:327 start_codon:yes stop_codon:yes gene_type:complete
MKRLIGVVGIVLLLLVIVSVANPSIFEFLNPVSKSPLPDTITVYAYGANGLVSKQKGSEVSYYHSDNLGSSSLVTDSSGVLFILLIIILLGVVYMRKVRRSIRIILRS